MLVVASGACRRDSPLHGAVLEPPTPAADFTLTDQHGQPFTLSAARGDVVVLYFGFTSCPDTCPTTLGVIKAALLPLGTDARRVRVAMVTVDGDRDTPDVLGPYMAAFDTSFLGLSGTPDELAGVYKSYGIEVTRRELPESALDYTIDHTASLSVIDAKGLVREMLYFGQPPKQLTADLRVLLKE